MLFFSCNCVGCGKGVLLVLGKLFSILFKSVFNCLVLILFEVVMIMWFCVSIWFLVLIRLLCVKVVIDVLVLLIEVV